MGTIKGSKHTAEHRAKIKASWTAERKASHSEAMKRYWAQREDKTLSPDHRAKLSEAHKGVKLSQAHRDAIRKSHLGKVKSEAHRRALSESTRQAWDEGRMPETHTEETRHRLSVAHKARWANMTLEEKEKYAKKYRGLKHSEESKQKMREATARRIAEGRHCNGFGRIGVRKDMGQFFRSTWEANYARVLNLRGVTWEYESRGFDTPYGYYWPDFYLPVTGVYVEIKGWERFLDPCRD